MQVSRFWTRVGTLAAAVMVQAASAGVVRHVYRGIGHVDTSREGRDIMWTMLWPPSVTCSSETEVARAGMVVAAE